MLGYIGRICYIDANKQKEKLQVLTLPGYVLFVFPNSFLFSYFKSNIL